MSVEIECKKCKKKFKTYEGIAVYTCPHCGNRWRVA
jgi:predicted RNA-binding Zn-ribbon protein involved in translation (DUF1610 family)